MDEESWNSSTYMDSQSVLLVKGTDDSLDNITSFLNLSPFIIDECAFIKNSEVSRIYFFQGWSSEDDSFQYYLFYKPSDPPLILSKSSNDFLAVIDLYEDFARAVFGKSINEIL